jgi:peptidoglycan/xylan/chitin deacetylase (PgdA/CDA1 family)
VDRRDLLIGLGSGATGLVVGSGAAAALGADIPGTPAASSRPRLEAANSAVPGSLTRLGTSRTIWSVRTTAALVALTFDDGPDPEFTPRILRALEHAGVHATFNVMGWNALQHADLLRQIVSLGHEVGNHTWTHQDLAFQSAAQARIELQRGSSAIEQVISRPIRFFRPPRGVMTGSALAISAELGYDLLLWSVTRGLDGGPGKPQEITEYVVNTVRPGDILGLHDGVGRGTFKRESAFGRGLVARREMEVQALPGILQRVADKGLRFVTATTLLANEDHPPQRAGP